MSAAVTLVFFGPQAPPQAVGALAIQHFTYAQLYLAAAGIAAATVVVFVWADRQRRPGSLADGYVT